jgi:hypothetical protein
LIFITRGAWDALRGRSGMYAKDASSRRKESIAG